MDWRIPTWLLLAWNAVILFWAASFVGSLARACPDGDPYCGLGTWIGAWIGLAWLLTLWLVPSAILTVIWFATRPPRRVCPTCGTEVRRGVMVCPRCGLDFARNAETPSHP